MYSQYYIRNAFRLFAILSLAGCSVQSDNSNFTYPDSIVTDATAWPALAPTHEFEKGANAELDRIHSPLNSLLVRSAKLRARAERLNTVQF